VLIEFGSDDIWGKNGEDSRQMGVKVNLFALLV
jgi:hypothetical protein